jgi:hypothetical protein
MKAKQFDQDFDVGKNVTKSLGLSKINRRIASARPLAQAVGVILIDGTH